MFGISITELVVVGVILIVAVGPQRMPGMLKAVVRGYREFRRATRELRASTGIDELLQDDDLRSLRKPLYSSPKSYLADGLRDKPAPKKQSLTAAEREREDPADGVDIVEARDAERRKRNEEAARSLAAKTPLDHPSGEQ